MKKLLLPIALIIMSCSPEDSTENSAEDSCEPTPKLTTAEAEDITDVSATISGTITPPSCNETVTSQGFVYGKENLPTVEDTKIVKSGSSISVSLTNLNQNTTYYIRTFFENPLGVFYGNEVVFSTNVGDVILRTYEVTNITNYNAQFFGEICLYGGGTVVSKGFCYSTESNPTVNDQKVDDLDDVVNTTFFSGTVENLTPNTLYYMKTYAENESGVFYSKEITFETRTSIFPTEFNKQRNADGIATDQNGNTFEWINYGTQDWAIEDAEVDTYRDGTPIPQVTRGGGNEWFNLTTGAWGYLDQNDPTRGKLYNWFAVMGIHDDDPNTPNKEFAPEGWHIPTDAEWKILENYLTDNGYTYDKIYHPTEFWQRNKIAKAMASTTIWKDYLATAQVAYGKIGSDQGLNNSSGFNALPLYDFGGVAFFWSTTEDRCLGQPGDSAYCWGLDYRRDFLSRSAISKPISLQVRFVKDN